MGKADFIEWIKADFRECSKADSRTALLLTAEMNISRALKMGPLFQEVTEASPEVPFLISRY